MATCVMTEHNLGLLDCSFGDQKSSVGLSDLKPMCQRAVFPSRGPWGEQDLCVCVAVCLCCQKNPVPWDYGPDVPISLFAVSPNPISAVFVYSLLELGPSCAMSVLKLPTLGPHP